ncbi:MAG: choice-of-anchor H family protein, partial [Shewanella sp.]
PQTLADKAQESALGADGAVTEDGADTEDGAANTVKPLKLMGAQPMTREQVQAEHRNNLARLSAAPQASEAALYHTFSIDSARSRLFEDADRDGFYRTFSVTFDVDVSGTYLNERADVFAELYLSRDGGPWVRYYTTEVFSIYGNANQDEYEVLTTLYNSYATDHYDVLIDVYEVGYSDVVASISADEVDSLYALPLESRDRDQHDDVIIIEGGALPSLTLLGLGLCSLVRRRRNRV